LLALNHLTLPFSLGAPLGGLEALAGLDDLDGLSLLLDLDLRAAGAAAVIPSAEQIQ